jgi:hypothetical protein
MKMTMIDEEINARASSALPLSMFGENVQGIYSPFNYSRLVTIHSGLLLKRHSYSFLRGVTIFLSTFWFSFQHVKLKRGNKSQRSKQVSQYCV